MIAIVNVGGDDNGICEYELRINSKVIGSFYHNRPDGLEQCLINASKVAKAEMEAKLYEYFISR